MAHDKGKPAARRGRKAHGSPFVSEVAGLPKGDLLLSWIAPGLAGGSCVAAVATLYLVWTVRQITLGAERDGDAPRTDEEADRKLSVGPDSGAFVAEYGRLRGEGMPAEQATILAGHRFGMRHLGQPLGQGRKGET